MSAHTLSQPQAGLLHGRQMVMLVIVALHALAIALMMTMHVLPDVKVPEFFRPIDLPPPEPPVVEPKPLQPTVDTRNALTPPTVTPLPTPDVIFPPDESRPDTSVVVPMDAGPVLRPATDGAGTARIPDIPSTPLQFRAVRPADDYYPSASLSLQEEGTAIVRVCVAPSGRMDGKPAIETTSGSTRLDAAALTWAREALRFTPATQGGAPIAACKGFRVTFKLH